MKNIYSSNTRTITKAKANANVMIPLEFVRTLTTLSLPAVSQLSLTIEKVRRLAKAGHLDEAFSLFYTVESLPSTDSYALLFHACARYNHLRVGKAIHQHMLIHNNANPVDLYTNNHLINMYAKCGDLHAAHQLFDEMPDRNIVSWTSLISGYSQHGKSDECFSMFSNMLPCFRPNDFAYTSVLSACHVSGGMQVHAHVLKTGFDACVYVGNALITMYWKNREIGIHRKNDDDDDDDKEAWRVFKSMQCRNLVTWNSMIAGLQMRGKIVKAMDLFTLMCGDGVGFDRATLVTVLSALYATDETDFFWGLAFCFQLHSVVIKSGFIGDVAVVTALLKAYSSLEGEIGDCYKLFLETNESRDVVFWTEIIATFAEKDPPKALFLFIQLSREGLRPDCHAFSIILKACGGFVTDKHSSAVYCQVVKAGYTEATILQNALIHAFARCGSLFRATQVFNEMKTRDIISWNSILKAYALHGCAREALDFFKKMDVEPNACTFVAILSACSHAGLVKEGTEIFNIMLERYGVVPQLDHYACMVDMLGRAGHLLEAEKIIKKMPMEPDYVVWSALLVACRTHGETQLANFALAKLKDLNPENSLGYVVLSNIYCSAGSFDEAGLVRKKMNRLGIKKEPGLSWTEIGNQVHEFASGGKRHPDVEVIRASLKGLIGQLKELGYSPESTLAMHDIEEEQKEEQLYCHSEKLALVFALINDCNTHGGETAIRIMKNIRICLDCHNFMKLASKLVLREIVVRDSNRFHHFQSGVCSCNDYW